MTTSDVAATRRRAALRGEEAVANWRIKTGTWAARVYAVVCAVPALAAILWHGPATAFVIAYSLVTAGLVLWASFRIARGGRTAAIAVLAFFVLDKALAVLSYGWQGLYQGLLIAAIIAFGLVQGVWGTSRRRAIAAEQARDAAAITSTTP
jgi:hypothetical protein